MTPAHACSFMTPLPACSVPSAGAVPSMAWSLHHSRSTLLLLRAGLGPAALGDPGLTLLGIRRLCPLQSGPEPACEHVPGAACACGEQPRAPRRPSSHPVGHPSGQAAQRLHLSAHRQASGTAAKLSSCPQLSPASLLTPSPLSQICQTPLPVCESRRAVLDWSAPPQALLPGPGSPLPEVSRLPSPAPGPL